MHWLKEETMSKKINTIYFTSILIGIAVFAGGCFKAGNTQAAQSLRAEVIQIQEETSQDSAADMPVVLEKSEDNDNGHDNDNDDDNDNGHDNDNDNDHDHDHDHGHDHSEIVVLPEAGEAQLAAVTESADESRLETEASREQERVETDQANQQAADQAETSRLEAQKNAAEEEARLEAERQVAAYAAEMARLIAQAEQVLTREYPWGEFHDKTVELQMLLGTSVDGVYGNATRQAHLAALADRGLFTDNVPSAPAPTSVQAPSASCSGMTCWNGYEGQNQAAVNSAINALPAELQRALSGVDIVNGCHPYAFASKGRCVFGVWDSAGWKADGTYGADWARSLWISNRAVEAGRLIDVAVHEAAHAYSYMIMRTCVNNATGETYRVDLRNLFGGEEFLADAITAYFNGANAFQNYRGTGTGLSQGEQDALTEMFATC